MVPPLRSTGIPGSPRTAERFPSPVRNGFATVLKSIFTWWNGATLGLRFTVGRRGVFVGQDENGNKYYEARDNRDSYDARKRRWVIYDGYAEASKVSPDWHGWLHYTFDEPPTQEPLLRRSWEKDHLPNLTGTVHAWRPKGAIARGGERSAATGDYEAWTGE
jgi:NADH:ubiquinone oxidoreductase subunit